MVDLPPWATRAPQQPVIVAVLSGSDAVGRATGSAEPPVIVRLASGGGSVPVDRYRVTAVVAGGATRVIDVPASAPRAEISGLGVGAIISVTAVALSVFDFESVAAGPVDHIVAGREDLPADPVSLACTAIAGGERRYQWTLDPYATGDQRTKITGFVLRSARGGGRPWSELTAFRGPMVGGSPLVTAEPLTSGVHTIGVASVDAYGRTCLRPKLITVDLDVSAAARLGRLDFSLAAQSGQELDGWL